MVDNRSWSSLESSVHGCIDGMFAGFKGSSDEVRYISGKETMVVLLGFDKTGSEYSTDGMMDAFNDGVSLGIFNSTRHIFDFKPF